MKNFSQLITEPRTNQAADTNEVIGILLASACLAFTCAPIIGAIGGGLNSFFSNLFGGGNKDNKDNKDDSNKDSKDNKDSNSGGNGDNGNKDNKDGEGNKDNKDNKDGDDKKSIDAFNSLLMLSRQANEKEKDANTKKKNDAMIKLITSCSFDKDGNQVPLDQIADKMKDTMSPEQFEAFKKDMTETYEKNKDNQDFKDALVKAKANIKPEDYDKMLEEAKKEAKATLEQLEKEKKEIAEYEQKLNDLDKQINGEKDGDKKDELLKQQQQLQQNPPQTLVGGATGVNPGGTPNNTGGEGEPNTEQEEKDLADKTEAAEKAKKAHEDAQKELDDLKGTLDGKDKDSQEYKDIQAKITEKEKSVADLKKASDDAEKAKNDAQTALDKKKKGGDPDPKPKEKTKEEIDAELKAVDDKYKKQEEDLEKEYQDKIDKETDKDKKKQLEDEWMEKQKEITKQKNKEKDAIDDNDTHDTEKDETKQGKYKVKDEEITDPKTGEKIKVKTYTGPRGGKFYYPEGSPKTPEHKVYLESITLSDYMYNLFY